MAEEVQEIEKAQEVQEVQDQAEDVLEQEVVVNQIEQDI